MMKLNMNLKHNFRSQPALHSYNASYTDSLTTWLNMYSGISGFPPPPKKKKDYSNCEVVLLLGLNHENVVGTTYYYY